MPRSWRHTILGAAIAGGLLTLLVCLSCGRRPSLRPARLNRLGPSPRPHRPVAAALAEAREWRQRAEAEVHGRREALEGWDPAAADPGDRESAAHERWRLQQLAADPGGFLRKAGAAGRRAAGLARSPGERYRTAVLMAAIEHELGHPGAELQQARALFALRPRSELSLLILRRAALCDGRPSLAVRIDRKLAALRQQGGWRTRLTLRRSPSAAALLESRLHWVEAGNAAAAEQSQLEAWDPAAAASPAAGPAETAGSPELRLADPSARRALALAHSSVETRQALRWLARIECARGRHGEELRLARRLVALSPRDEGSLTCLLQAARCNGLRILAEQTFAALQRRHSSLAARAGRPATARTTGKRVAAG